MNPKPDPQDENTPPMVPLMVDTIKLDRDFRMTRLSYWVMDLDLLDQHLLPERVKYASVMTMRAKVGLSVGEYVEGGIMGEPFAVPAQYSGMQVVVLGSEAGPPARFTASGLEDLFARVHETDILSIETASLWLPNEIVKKVQPKPERGQLFRVSPRLFASAQRYKSQKIDLGQFVKELDELKGAHHMAYSQEDTQALQDWTKSRIAAMRSKYERMKRNKRPLAYRQAPENGGGS